MDRSDRKWSNSFLGKSGTIKILQKNKINLMQYLASVMKVPLLLLKLALKYNLFVKLFSSLQCFIVNCRFTCHDTLFSFFFAWTCRRATLHFLPGVPLQRYFSPWSSAAFSAIIQHFPPQTRNLRCLINSGPNAAFPVSCDASSCILCCSWTINLF